MRPIAIPTASGTANRSPVERRSPSSAFTTSTAISPPSNPPTTVFPAIRNAGSVHCARKAIGSSSQASSLLPRAPPSAAAVIAHQRVPLGMSSVRRARSHRKTRKPMK